MKGFFMKYAGKIGQMAPVFLRTEADGIPTHPVKREEVSSSMGLKCLVYNHKNTERKVDFAAENLENRKIRINTHTHIILNVLYRGCMGGCSFFQGVYHPFLYAPVSCYWKRRTALHTLDTVFPNDNLRIMKL